MKNVSFKVVLAACVLGLALSACSVRVGDFTLWSTKNADLGNKYVKTGRFEAKSMTKMILFIPLHIGNLKEAVDRTIEAGGGDALTNCVLFQESLPLIIYNEGGFRIEADVWKKAAMGDLIDPSKEVFEMIQRADGTREMVSTKDMTKTEKVFDADAYAAANNVPAGN